MEMMDKKGTRSFRNPPGEEAVIPSETRRMKLDTARWRLKTGNKN